MCGLRKKKHLGVLNAEKEGNTVSICENTFLPIYPSVTISWAKQSQRVTIEIQ